MSSLQKSIPWILLSWFALNVLQAATTGLMNDETYYWVYTQFPDWGYLDHPPAVMVMILLGELLGHHPLTTRLMTIVLSSATLWLVLKILPGKSVNLKIFLPLYLSLPLLHVFGFITVPDAPLLFFTALYFWALKGFLRKDDLRNFFWLMIAVTGMIYAKYHAVLVIGFTLIALPRLFANKRFYFIAIAATLLYLPHILWQVRYDYPSIQYHLFDRADVPYVFEFTTGYLLTQMLVLGPLSFWVVFRAVGHYLTRFPTRSRDPKKRFSRVMQVQFWGFFGFFFLMSFRGLVEGNWTAPMMVPALFLTYVYLERDARIGIRRWAHRTLMASIVLVFLLRIIIAVPLGDFSKSGQMREFHYNKTWAKEIKGTFEETPVVFYDAYKHPSVYWYYTGVPAHSESSITYRMTQFDYWPTDSLHWGQRVAWIGGMPKKEKRILEHSFGSKTKYMIDTCYYSLNDLRVKVQLPESWSSSKPLPLTVEIFNRSADSIDIPNSYPFYLSASFKQGKEVVDTLKLKRIDKLQWAPGETVKYDLELTDWPQAGDYIFRISLQKAYFWPGLNGRSIDLQLSE